MKILYIDPIFGISGDMTISAFIDLGMPFEEIEALLAKVPLTLPRITPVRMEQGVIEGVHLNIDESHLHLSIAEMERTIAGLDIEGPIKKDALAMLDIVIGAESKIHGIGREELHLHELSHVDTLIDLLCVAKGMHYFQVDQVFCGPVPCGRGTIKTAHGMIPNPPPVTLEILSGFPIVIYDEALELTTPTGAVIVRHYTKSPKAAPPFIVEKTGYGVGTYKTSRPDALRLFLGTTGEASSDETVWVIECDLDDMETEYMGAVTERIKDLGALDVLTFPVSMKKGRPGTRLSITVPVNILDTVVEAVFRETSTFGMRLRKEERRVLKRKEEEVKTKLGQVRIKKGYDTNGQLIKVHIEFEDVKRIAEEERLPYREALDILKSEIGYRKP